MPKRKNIPPPTLSDLGIGGTANDEYSHRRARTYPGQAHFACAPYGGDTCRQCVFWDFNANAGGGIRYAETGMLKGARCLKACQDAMRMDLPRVPHFALACKHFQPNESAPEAFVRHGGDFS